MSKFREVLDESVAVTSTKREFRTFEDSVATYESTKKMSFFHLERIEEEDDGILFLYIAKLYSLF